jgi:hypothetical protein
MSYLLRKITRKKWDPNMESDPNQYTADAITGCTRTSQNTLSVWHSCEKDFNSQECNLLVTALASSMERPDAIDLVWLQEPLLIGKGVVIEQTKGGSKCESANDSHKDLIDLRHKDLAIVAEHIVEQLNQPENFKRFSRAKLLEIMLDASCITRIVDFHGLSEKWQANLLKKMSPELRQEFEVNKVA